MNLEIMLHIKWVEDLQQTKKITCGVTELSLYGLTLLIAYFCLLTHDFVV